MKQPRVVVQVILRGRMFLWFLFLIVMAGCRTLQPFPASNLSEPGWNVRQGQAVWRTSRQAPEIAGEILLATQANGNAFIQFTKTPFPLVIAQQTTNRWQIQFPTENKRYSGSGRRPSRLIWLWLSQAFAGKLPAEKWSWQVDENGWRLENRATGELLQGYLINGSPTH